MGAPEDVEDADSPCLRLDRLWRHPGRSAEREVEELALHLVGRRLAGEPDIGASDEAEEESPDPEGRRRDERAEEGDDDQGDDDAAPSHTPPPRGGQANRSRQSRLDPGPPEHVVPVAEDAGRRRNELADRAEEHFVGHRCSSGRARRSAACAPWRVADTVPVATPRISPIAS